MVSGFRVLQPSRPGPSGGAGAGAAAFPVRALGGAGSVQPDQAPGPPYRRRVARDAGAERELHTFSESSDRSGAGRGVSGPGRLVPGAGSGAGRGGG